MFMNGCHSSDGGAIVYPFSAERGDSDWDQVEQLQKAWKREYDRRLGNKRIE
jgi:hypothetical protein